MAISFAHVSIHTRTKGHSAVAAAAYRAGIKLYDDRLGKNYDFSNRDDVKYSEILLPEGAHEEFTNREFLWNQAEQSEKRKNSQVSKDYVLALPKEIDVIDHIEIAKRFAQVHFVDNGLPADIAIHDHGDGNPHAHILVTTRRLKGDRFDTHKARDLNPSFGRGFITEDEHWNDKWRNFQNSYFEEKGFDISVDLDHVIPENHHGGHNNIANHYVREENEIIKNARQEIALNDIDNFINIISIEHSVFTRRDIEMLLFKTIKKENYHEFFQVTLERILANKNIICLGENDQGQIAYTTRNQFTQENQLLKDVEKLQSRKAHFFDDAAASYVENTSLNEEQKQAFDFIVSGGDISCVVGRPGVGKSYMLTPVKSFYESHGNRVLGVALSGKVAKQLQNESDISSSTIASLTTRLISGKETLTSKDILVIDEAGMVDFSNMSFLINRVKEAGAKIIMVGDPDQLKPIKKGAIFKGVSDHVGCFTMVDIKRQKHAGDRSASIHLAKGEVHEALSYYRDKHALSIARNEKNESASSMLMDSWKLQIQSNEDLKHNIILAHANATIHELNQKARDSLIHDGILDTEQFRFVQEKKERTDKLLKGTHVVVTHTDSRLGLMGGEKGRVLSSNELHIKLQMNDDRVVTLPSYLRRYVEKTTLHDCFIAKGERILFKKGDKDIGIKNGDIGSVISISGNQFVARLDSGETVTVPKRYKQFDYAYAMTVHKSQGMSVKNSFVCLDTKWWDRALSFVAFTRHKEQLAIFSDDCNYSDFSHLVQGLSKQGIADNVIDYPIRKGQRHGFGFETLVERAVSHLTKTSRAIKGKADFLYNYVRAIKQHNRIADDNEPKTIRNRAKTIAQYIDMTSKLKVQHAALKQHAEKTNKAISDLDGFDYFYKLASGRDKKASDLLKTDSKILKNIKINRLDVEKIKAEAKRYDSVLAVKQALRIKESAPSSHPKLCEQLSAIDMGSKPNQIMIKQLAKQTNIESGDIIHTVQSYQKHYRTRLLQDLAKKHPALKDYMKLTQEQQNKSSQMHSTRREKILYTLAQKIASDKSLSMQINQHLPKLRKKLQQSVQKGLDRGRGVER